MDAADLDILEGQRFTQERLRLPGLNGRAKLGVNLARADFRMGVRVDARGQAEQNILRNSSRPGLNVDGGELVQVVADNAANPVGNGERDILVGLVIPMEIDALHRKAGPVCRVQLTWGDNIHPQALLRGDLIDVFKAQRLAGVEGHGAGGKMRLKSLGVDATARPNFLLVQQHQRGAKFLGEGGGVKAGNGQPSGVVDS